MVLPSLGRWKTLRSGNRSQNPWARPFNRPYMATCTSPPSIWAAQCPLLCSPALPSWVVKHTEAGVCADPQGACENADSETACLGWVRDSTFLLSFWSDASGPCTALQEAGLYSPITTQKFNRIVPQVAWSKWGSVDSWCGKCCTLISAWESQGAPFRISEKFCNKETS